MGFSTTSQYIRLDSGPKEGKIYLYAECDDGDDWKLSKICLDDYLGISQGCKGFDITSENTASAQNKPLTSYFVPDSLILKDGSVLHGKVREEDGGWDTSIYLDILFDNDAGTLKRWEWPNSLVVTAGLLGASSDGKSLTGLLLSPNGKLTTSELLMGGKCDYFDVMDERGVRPSSDGSVERVYPLLHDRSELVLGCLLFENRSYGFGSRSGSVSLRKYLSSSKGILSMDEPSQVSNGDLPATVIADFQKELPNVAFGLAGKESLANETTRPFALCIYTAVMTCGAVLNRIIFGKVGTGYAAALAFKAGSTVKSATGPIIRDPKMSDEVAAVAIYRVLKEEIPAITGTTVKEVLNMSTELQGGSYDEEKYVSPYTKSTLAAADLRDIDKAVFDGAMGGWGRIITSVEKALTEDMSEDDLKHMFDDKNHDGVDLLDPPATGEKDYISDWVQSIKDIQAELYLLEPDIGASAEKSTNNALEAISNGLDGLNQLLDFWPDYKGDDETNETRTSIINSATELIEGGVKDVKETDQDTSVLDKVHTLEEKLTGLKTKFHEETTVEKAELDKIKSELPTVVEKMFADWKLYQSAQGALLVKIRDLGNAELKHDVDASIQAGVTWYKDLLRRRTSALEEPQSLADAAAATYLKSEKIVVDLQAHQAKLNNVSKLRFSVDREIAKAEMIIGDLKIMINGTKQQEDRILTVTDLLSSTFNDLLHVGEPPYHRQDRKIEDQLCTTVLKAHRESLIDLAFVDSAKKAVTTIQSWFDDDMPKKVQEEIDAITKNPLYQSQAIDDDDGVPLVGGGR